VLPVADALCRFNPIHGQGMSSAAKQARLLQSVMGRAAAEPDAIAALQAGFMAEVASVLGTPWNMSTSADLAFPETHGERPENFAEAREFEAAVYRTAVADPVVHRAMIEVAQLLQPISRLQEPDIMRRIEAGSAKSGRLNRPEPRPFELSTLYSFNPLLRSDHHDPQRIFTHRPFDPRPEQDP
jgi:hypothetical protein